MAQRLSSTATTLPAAFIDAASPLLPCARIPARRFRHPCPRVRPQVQDQGSASLSARAAAVEAALESADFLQTRIASLEEELRSARVRPS